MTIEFSRHAERRMRERSIPRDAVADALTSFSKISHIANDLFMFYHRVKGETLVAIAAKRRNAYKVVTVHYENHV